MQASNVQDEVRKALEQVQRDTSLRDDLSEVWIKTCEIVLQHLLYFQDAEEFADVREPSNKVSEEYVDNEKGN